MDVREMRDTLKDMDKAIIGIEGLSDEPEELPRKIDLMVDALHAAFQLLDELVGGHEDHENRLAAPVSR